MACNTVNRNPSQSKDEVMLHQTQPWSRPDSIRVTGRVGKEKHVLPRGQGRAEILETELL